MASPALRLGAALGVAVMLVTITCGAGAASASTSLPGPFAVGDSVMLGAQPCLERRGFGVDAQGNRQVSAIPGELSLQGDLPPLVIVHTGTNGGADRAELDQVMRVIGPKRDAIFVTIQLPDGTDRYTFEASTNQAIRAMPHRYPNAYVADWNRLSDQHPEWTGGDGIHLTPTGCEGYARVLAREARRVFRAEHPYQPMRPLLIASRAHHVWGCPVPGDG